MSRATPITDQTPVEQWLDAYQDESLCDAVERDIWFVAGASPTHSQQSSAPAPMENRRKQPRKHREKQRERTARAPAAARGRRLPRLGPGSRACVVCGTMHAGTFGAGRYCSRSCSHRASALVKWGHVSRDELLHAEHALGHCRPKRVFCRKNRVRMSNADASSAAAHCAPGGRAAGCAPVPLAPSNGSAVVATPPGSRQAASGPEVVRPLERQSLTGQHLHLWLARLRVWQAVYVREYDVCRDQHLVCLRDCSDAVGHETCCHWISLRAAHLQLPPLEPPSPDLIEQLLCNSPASG